MASSQRGVAASADAGARAAQGLQATDEHRRREGRLVAELPGAIVPDERFYVYAIDPAPPE